ncbi:hypothetical protein OPQ81_010428 [Rhizoctonia solani]|nr:hypothetical protein OPQ81_010428 [Rhizoctonia solani]
MSVKYTTTHGPRAELCLTCKQRRRKYEKGRPFCEICLSSKREFTRLGYDDKLGSSSDKDRLGTVSAGTFLSPDMRVGMEFAGAIPTSHTRSAYFGFPASASEMNDYLSPSVDSLMVPGPQITPRYKSRNVMTLPLPASIPRGVNANKLMRESYLAFILEEYESHRVDKFFRPKTWTRGFLASKVFEALNGKQEEAAIKSCSRWVTRYSNHVSNPHGIPNPYPSIQEVEDRLNGLLELIFVKFVVLGTAAGYATLRLALPDFLRLVSDDPCFCVEQERSGLLGVSLPAAITSDRIEMRRFAFYDVMCSFVLGLPTLAEYDSTGFLIAPRRDNPLEWVHGVPIELIINIAEVHKWRAQTNNVDWQVLEARTLAWRWNQDDIQSEDSVKMVYRVAIQEAWRHATLIYIYMGICGTTSHDPRVQASVRQIIQLMGVVEDTHLDVHFSIPSIAAGIAAQYEPQRRLIHRKLETFNGIRLCTLPGRDFARVLEYLWHGPAIDGAAIVWDEYIMARCKVLPIE